MRRPGDAYFEKCHQVATKTVTLKDPAEWLKLCCRSEAVSTQGLPAPHMTAEYGAIERVLGELAS